jgi:DinB superfamily
VKEQESMPHPLIIQLRFARSEFKRALEGLSDTDACHRFLPMNCISWNNGHLVWQEQRYWLTRLQGLVPLPNLNELVGYGQPACTPPLVEMWEAWQTITQLANPFLDTLTTQK